ncbi:hypothetical protein GCM10009678_08200 [Actinomadura kijaniata]
MLGDGHVQARRAQRGAPGGEPAGLDGPARRDHRDPVTGPQPGVWTWCSARPGMIIAGRRVSAPALQPDPSSHYTV